MKTVAEFQLGLDKIYRLQSENHLDQALAEASQMLEDWPDNPYLLTLLGNLIQLQDGEEGSPTLETAKSVLERAMALDPDSPAALVELGNFLFAVEDDAGAGAKCFARAIGLSKRSLQEALLGNAKALAELGGHRKEALASLAFWMSLQNFKGDEAAVPDEEKLAELHDIFLSLTGSSSQGSPQ